MGSPSSLKLGVQICGVGYGWGEWRHPDVPADASISLNFYRQQAQLAEAGRLDFLFIADSLHIHEKSNPHYLNRFEPLTLLSALATVTEHIGLVATASVSYTEPFNLARQLASLDHLSGGRAGWNVVTSWLSGTADNFGKAEHPPHRVRYYMAREHLSVVKGLWDSWEDDAFVRDKPSGEFFLPSKLHRLDHNGEFFRVKGPLNIARSPQGQPVIFQGGTSVEGREFAAGHADVVFLNPESLTEAQWRYQDIKGRAACLGRNLQQVQVLANIRPVVGRTASEVEQRYQHICQFITLEDALVTLGRPFNDHDFSRYPLDEPFPDVGDLGREHLQGHSEHIKQVARDEKLTLRQTAWRFALPQREFTGTPEQLADRLEHWFQQGAADGFVINPWPGGLQHFVELVIPELQRRGLFRREYSGHTLRDHLQLSTPINRYAPRRELI
ncbi:FMN-dependent oxidoreductase (nitrilotriacetate monooxygenase family) [Azomonas agilis]|uniref:FMN-dependent oxidoreductase (Nitrilotriacetate monooxygenase family) n=1 Tax=Azomonas agilis TaxID=116849 RepID=A0A562IXY7_9GAMM|nr:LLM class flavin-dependent oxidoreductase [Azomonas agilis]TWH75921.1 FMN-dependent oxidoreductase (nitrilotriacetate monooxygenase family) [Azomonas agilis]